MTNFTMAAAKEIHLERMKAIDRAARAVERAANLCYNSFLEHAAENIRLARIQEEKDYEAKVKLWGGE